MKKTSIEFHGIAVAETSPVATTATTTKNTTSTSATATGVPKAFLTFKGPDPYIITGIVMVEIALAILFDEDSMARKMGGGVLTPATLASETLLTRLDQAGVKIESRII